MRRQVARCAFRHAAERVAAGVSHRISTTRPGRPWVNEPGLWLRLNTGDLRPEDANDWSDGGHRPRRCGGRPFAWEVAHLAFDRAGILARAPWGQPLGAEFVQEVVAKKGNAS